MHKSIVCALGLMSVDGFAGRMLLSTNETKTTTNISSPELADKKLLFDDPLMDIVAVSSLAPKKDTKAGGSSSSLLTTMMVINTMNENQQSNNVKNGKSRKNGKNGKNNSKNGLPLPAFSSTTNQEFTAPVFADPNLNVQYAQMNGNPRVPGSILSINNYPPQNGQNMDNKYQNPNNRYQQQQDSQSDKMKSMMTLAGVASGAVKPMVAVAMNRDPGMDAQTAVLMNGASSPVATMMMMNQFGPNQGNGNGIIDSSVGQMLIMSSMMHKPVVKKVEVTAQPTTQPTAPTKPKSNLGNMLIASQLLSSGALNGVMSSIKNIG